MEASNNVENLQGVDRDVAVAQAADAGLSSFSGNSGLSAVAETRPLSETESQIAQGIVQTTGYIQTFPAQPLTPAEYSPSYVTRAEFNDLLARIEKFNSHSPHPF